MGLLVLGTVPSTMDIARDMVREGQVTVNRLGETEPIGILALNQTEGRGQRGRYWHSLPGESMCATFFLPVSPTDEYVIQHLAFITGLAAIEAIQHSLSVTAPGFSAEIKLKWPNDLMLNGKKLGGVLIERTSHPKIGTIAMIGMGINIANSHFPAEISDTATSLAIEGVPLVAVQALAYTVWEHIGRRLSRHRLIGLAGTLADWRSHDCTRGRTFRIDTAEGTALGIADGVDDNGRLIVITDTGARLSVLSASSLRESRAQF